MACKRLLGCSDKPITNIANNSLSLGVFPRFMEAALVKPLMKNHTNLNESLQSAYKVITAL